MKAFSAFRALGGVVILTALCAPPSSAVSTLPDFNVITFGDFTGSDSDVEGRLGVGGTATLSNYSIGSQLTADPGRYDLVVNGDLDFTNGQVFNGSIGHSGIVNLSSVGVPNGTIDAIPPNSVLDFLALEALAQSESVAWNAVAANGTTSSGPGGINLTGSDPVLNVFALGASALASTTGLTINAPSSSRVIVNVDGGSPSAQAFGFFLGGLSPSSVLFNFFEATELTLGAIGFKGAILAPGAAIQFDNGHIDGQVVAQSIEGTGEFHNVLFDSPPPPDLETVPEPSTITLLMAGLSLALWRRRSATGRRPGS